MRGRPCDRLPRPCVAGSPILRTSTSDFFGCPVQFGAEENAFVLSAKDADRPLPSANRQLAATFDKMLTEELARLDKSDVVSRCRAAVLEHLSSGEGTAEDTAKQLHMSPRTLQRKLAEANTTYLQLVDDTRKDLALRYIEDPRRSVTDITFSLGFSQPSASLARSSAGPAQSKRLARQVKRLARAGARWSAPPARRLSSNILEVLRARIRDRRAR